MLYLINGKYYIKTAPLKYTEVAFQLRDEDVIITSTKNRIESNGETIIKCVDFQKEKNAIKKKLENKEDKEIVYKKRNKR